MLTRSSVIKVLGPLVWSTNNFRTTFSLVLTLFALGIMAYSSTSAAEQLGAFIYQDSIDAGRSVEDAHRAARQAMLTAFPNQALPYWMQSASGATGSDQPIPVPAGHSTWNPATGPPNWTAYTSPQSPPKWSPPARGYPTSVPDHSNWDWSGSGSGYGSSNWWNSNWSYSNKDDHWDNTNDWWSTGYSTKDDDAEFQEYLAHKYHKGKGKRTWDQAQPMAAGHAYQPGSAPATPPLGPQGPPPRGSVTPFLQGGSSTGLGASGKAPPPVHQNNKWYASPGGPSPTAPGQPSTPTQVAAGQQNQAPAQCLTGTARGRHAGGYGIRAQSNPPAPGDRQPGTTASGRDLETIKKQLRLNSEFMKAAQRAANAATGFNKTGLTTCGVPKASEQASLCELQSREFFEIYLGRIQRACGSHPSLTSGFYHQAGFSAANF